MENTIKKATREDVEKLKEDWLKDASFDLEEEEGFEEYKDELLAFRKEHEADWAQKAEEKYRHNCAALYDMKFGEWRHVDDGVSMRRVPGGWVMEYENSRWDSASEQFVQWTTAAVFIPFNNEFQEVRA